MPATALDHARDLARAPGVARKLRAEPLPQGVQQVLRLASGDDQELDALALESGRSASSVRETAIRYVSLVLLDPAADCYRTLGATPSAMREELRANMVLLLKWLRPDLPQDDTHAVFVARVLRAWNSVKDAEQRQRYDAVRNPVSARRRLPGRRTAPRVPPDTAADAAAFPPRHGGRMRLASYLALVACGLAVFVMKPTGETSFGEAVEKIAADVLLLVGAPDESRAEPWLRNLSP
jgi:hypothetical protein